MTIDVFRLAYVDFNTPDAEALTDYYENTMGYTITDSKDGSTYLTNGYDHHNIVVTQADDSSVRSYGYQVAPGTTLEEIQQELKDNGFDSEIKKDAKPGVAEFVEVFDPAGNKLDLFLEIDQNIAGFSGRGINPLKLGHIAFKAVNYLETIDFYKKVLGFHFTDKIGDEMANFLTCNYEHHVINIVNAPETALHHIAFQVKDASHQYDTGDFLAKQDIPIIWGPQRHTAGSNIASYHFDTDKNVIELYTDMDVYIPELDMFEPRPWHQELPYKPKTWYGLSGWGTEYEIDLSTL